jgi:hypothetical protein
MKCLEKRRTNSWFLLPGNSPAYWSVLVKDFLAKNDATTLEHTPYLPDLAPADFYLFPQLKSAFKDGIFVMLLTSLRMQQLSQIGFQEVSNTFAVAGRSVQLHKGTF